MRLRGLNGKRWLVVVSSVALIGVFGATGAIGAHSFLDVPDDHVFHDDIEWMKENRITIGCNPPANTEYCPGEFTTRGQMAAFIHRLSDSGVVNAGTLDGLDSTEFITRTEAEELGGIPGPQGPQGEPGEFSVDNVTIREASGDTGLIQVGSSYIATCESGEVAIAGGYDADLDLVDLSPLSGVLSTLGLGDLVTALDGVSTTSISGNEPIEHDGLFGWQITTSGAALSDLTVRVVCAG